MPFWSAPAPPEGYVAVGVGRARGAALWEAADAVDALLARGPLHAVASVHPERREFTGRLPAYAIPLDDRSRARVVVRHGTHGGLLAPITRDLFVAPTRAPYELDVSLRLLDAGVPTPELVAYVLYPAGPLLRRVDVMTRLVDDGRDLPTFLGGAPRPRREEAFDAVARLLRLLAACGARHPDLNLKNVLLAPDDTGALVAWVLDVDRIYFGEPGDAGIGEANLRRLARSAEKWRSKSATAPTAEEMRRLREAALPKRTR